MKNICELSNDKDTNLELTRLKTIPSQSLDVCNDYFANVGQSLASSILGKLGKNQDDLAALVNISSVSPNSFFMVPTDPVEIMDIIKKLKHNSAPGLDGIKNSLLKKVGHLLVEPLSHVINLSLCNGVFPDCWKTASVVPIHKSGPKTEPSNYRPISLLPVFSKILEKVVNKRLVNFLEHEDTLTPFQYGFRQRKSTEDAVSHLVDEVVSSLDVGGRCMGVFLDLAKAFDTVSPIILLQKLERLGIRGNALDWFRSYLSDRGQCVSVAGYSSSVRGTSFGVPQGSILGPTLFIVYINDIANLFSKSNDTKFVCYADDTALIFKGKTWENVFNIAELGLSSVAAWLDLNLLTLNADKTKYLCFHKTVATSPPVSLTVKIHKCGMLGTPKDCSCELINRAECIKYLGIVLDERLAFRQHINSLSGRVRKFIHIIKLLRDGADKETLLMVYSALCQSILCYCLPVWGGAAKTFIIKLERAQRSVLRVMFRKPFRYPTKQLHQETKTLTVRQLYIQKVVLAYHQLFSKRTYVSNSRRLKVKVPLVKTIFATRFKHFSFPFIYKHAITQCELESCSLYGVKAKIRKWLLTLDYDETESLLVALV